MSVISQFTDAVLRWVSPNEVGFDQLDLTAEPGTPQHDDPSKFRFGAWWLPRGKFYIGILGMDVLRRRDNGSIHREEVGFVKLAVDEMVDGDGDPVPMVQFYLAPKVGQSSDADMQPVMTISRKGVRFHVDTNASGGGPQSFLRSPSGQYEMEIQDDGNVVVYDEHNGHTPVSAFRLGFGL